MCLVFASELIWSQLGRWSFTAASVIVCSGSWKERRWISKSRVVLLGHPCRCNVMEWQLRCPHFSTSVPTNHTVVRNDYESLKTLSLSTISSAFFFFFFVLHASSTHLLNARCSIIKKVLTTTKRIVGFSNHNSLIEEKSTCDRFMNETGV